jgi:poly(glycerol-phosphate) alpha-glucosyltransferase
MLHPEALKISKWKKDIAKTIFLSKLFKRASCFHALNQTEYEYIRKFGVKVPISIIGNGIEMSNTNSLINNFELPFEYNKQKICLYLGRLHPIKGVDRLIDAWISAKISPDWILIIAGSGDIRYENELKNKAKNNYKNIYFVGYVNESRKNFFYNISTFTVLPSHSEAFPMSVLESFAHKKPVLITSACIFEEALQVNAVISVKSSKEDIIIGLERFVHLKDSEIIDMGQNGFNLAKNDFSWDIIYNKLCEMYNWMQHRKILPNFIFLK